jgi:hypothetical protein
MMECWNTGMVEWWDDGMLECWDGGMMAWQDIRRVKGWPHGKTRF